MTIVETEIRPKTVEEEQVERGAAWLDEHRPLWYEEINLARLDLNYCDLCIIGQLYGEYWSTLKRLDIDHEMQEGLGFEAYEVDDDSWDRLTEAWRDEIARRRA